ncbi:MAG: ROK family protein [Alphaproteobacteria bacterium]|nr:ROK family protein [Alphaproteobacteria bacterium]
MELKDNGGFLGDRASKKALAAILDKARKPLIKEGRDPFDERPSTDIGKKELDRALEKGDAETAGLIHTVVEEFSQELAFVVRRFLKEKNWKDVERIAVGGGMRGHRIGELAVGRLSALLKAEKIDVEVVPIANDPDDAGLLGAVHLAPEWVFKGHDAIIAIDIGGTNMRVGVVTFDLKKSPGFAGAAVAEREIWCHADDDTTRDKAVDALVEMIGGSVRKAEKAKLKLAPFVGIGCPGIVKADGSIDRGTQNLPGNWASSRFNLPQRIAEALPLIGGYDTQVVLHNDAVVQGLSEIPNMTDVQNWGILTLGTGLGNACFANRIIKS